MAQWRPRILVVDDNEDNRYTLSRQLKQVPEAEIATAADGALALADLAAAPADLVLLDLRMPGLDGFGVLEQMKADMALRDIPVIMVSANDDFESVLRCIKLGADDFVPKPVNAHLLRARVDAALNRRRLARQEAAFVEQVQAEKARADDLLNQMLPRGVVGELKSTGAVAPRRLDNVAILFCDVVGFTAYCDANPPEKVVAELRSLMAAFEDVAASAGLEKIKTIGDAFMAAAGLLNFAEHPALMAAECGLALVKAAAAHAPPWQVRVGIHQGPVVAGVMGKRQFAFDVWGDTVNVAARAMHEAEPGAVLVTGGTWLSLRAHCQGRSAGIADLKGKGKTELVRYLGKK